MLLPLFVYFFAPPSLLTSQCNFFYTCVVGCQVCEACLMFGRPAEQATEPRAKQEVRWAVTYQELASLKRHHCALRKPTLIEEVNLLACMPWAQSTVEVQRLITTASRMHKPLKLLDNSTNCSCIYKN